MKFLVVFVHEQDSESAADALRDEGFRFTVLESEGGFLRQPSKTFLMGVQEERVEECLDVFRTHCETRTEGAPGSILEGERVEGDEYIEKYQPATVEVGGAVAFMLNAERVL